MEYNFDKQIDTLLRQAAQSGQVVSTADFDAHLDADEISMFAENALPEKARNRAMKHLAECNNCRSILSNLILLNEETKIETVSHVAEEKTVQTAALPWYRKLFIFPQIAYAMGALALVFSGFAAFLIYQATNQTANFEVAKSSPIMANSNAFSPKAGDGETEFDEDLSNTMSANVGLSTDANANFDIAEKVNSKNPTLNTPTARIPSDEKSGLNEQINKKEISPAENRPEVALKSTAIERKDNENNTAGDVSTADSSMMRETMPPTALQRSNAAQKKLDKKNEAQTKLADKSETRKQIGSKTFNFVNGVWIDSDYRQISGGNFASPPMTIITRGSKQYKKLDQNIRIIAESLEGTVIVVSNNKAYRIQ